MNDSGPGSLRQVITDANHAPGTDVIDFAIPGAGVHIISPLTPLPTITDAVTIDGYSQPGSRPNSKADGDDAVIAIAIDGGAAPPNTYFPGLTLAADNVTVQGLAIGGFRGPGIGLGFVNTTQGIVIRGISSAPTPRGPSPGPTTPAWASPVRATSRSAAPNRRLATSFPAITLRGSRSG